MSGVRHPLVLQWRAFVRRRPGRFDAEISRQKMALKESSERIDRDFPYERGDCCQSCRYGRPYSDAVDSFERAGKWLCILLRKRGTFRDHRLARAIEVSAWP